MKAHVDEDVCIGCELCVDICPSVFEMGDDGFSHVIADPVPAESEDDAREAAESCPTSAITLDE